MKAVGDLHAHLQRTGSADVAVLAHHQLAADAIFGHAHDQIGIRPCHQRSGGGANRDRGPSRTGKILAANLKFAAGDRGRGGYFENLRTGIGGFARGHKNRQGQLLY